MAPDPRNDRRREERGAVAAIGFGTTVALWAVGYVSRLPGIGLPGPLVLAAMLATMAIGGACAGRWAARPVRTGALAGLTTAALNLLILGSLLADRPAMSGARLAAAAALALLFGALWGAGSAALAARLARSPGAPPDWVHALAAVTSFAVFLLLVAGGLVTSKDAGLAVPDWPRSFGYNMFLYPLSRMTGGIYFEHTHRLLGSLVGLTTLALAFVAGRSDRRPAVRRLLAAAVLLVVVQGILGGIRVTERNLTLALLHGVTGQVFFALTVLLAAMTGRRFKAGPAPLAARGAPVEHRLTLALLLLMLFQLTVGAVVRHRGDWVFAHIAVAIAVAALALTVGLRAWGLYPGLRLLGTSGLGLIALTGLQILLGFGAFVVTQAGREGPAPWYEVLFATAHQATGALLLAAATWLAAWSRRLLSAGPPHEGRAAG